VSLDLTGQVTIVDFFATWCPRCRESLPSYAKLLAAHGDRVRIIVVDVGEPAALVRRFFERRRLPANVTVVMDPDARAIAQFGEQSFPSFYVLDEKGVLRHRLKGWGSTSADRLGEWIAGLLGVQATPAAKATASRRPVPSRKRRRPEPTPASVSADERARRMGVEILR
jgi:hypothetical protein